MTAPKNPRASSLPGISNIKTSSAATDPSSGTGSFLDKNNASRVFQYQFTNHGSMLLLEGPGGAICSFERCPQPHQNLWYATGLMVGDAGVGLASGMYALARDLLAQNGHAITPSGNITAAGAGFWHHLDPGIRKGFAPHPTVQGDYSF